jgi:hypothetical protein
MTLLEIALDLGEQLLKALETGNPDLIEPLMEERDGLLATLQGSPPDALKDFETLRPALTAQMAALDAAMEQLRRKTTLQSETLQLALRARDQYENPQGPAPSVLHPNIRG